jgi:hypothetical protein
MRGPCGRGGTHLALTRHGDLIAVGNVRRQVYRDKIGIVRRTTRFCERISCTSIAGKRIHSRVYDRACNIHERLRPRRERSTNGFVWSAEFGRWMRSELRRSQHERKDNRNETGAADRSE